MSRPPYNQIEPQHYVCADTGRLIESVPMRRFYEWDRKKDHYVKVREYHLANEARVNPGFRARP